MGGNQPNIRIQMRNAESVLIKDSYFNDLPSNGLEIFNVNNVTIFHTEFYNGTSDSIVVNGGVKNVHVKDCLMDKHAILPLDHNSTEWIGPNPAGVESTGAVVLAFISALLLLIAI